MEWLWVAIAIGFIVIELSTQRVVSVWFAISALIVSLIRLIFPSLGLGWQFAVFVVLSVVLFAATRPLVRKIMNKNKNKSDTDKSE